MYNIFRLLIGVPDYSSESYREKQKLIRFIVIISQRGVSVIDSHIQRIVLATEKTTVIQQVSHRPIKC